MFSRIRKTWSRSFAFRTTLSFVCLLALAVATTSVAIYWGLRHSLLRETDEILEGDIREFARHLGDARWDESLLKSELEGEVASRGSQGVFYRLIDSSGRELWTVPKSMNGQLMPPRDAVLQSLAGDRSHHMLRGPAGQAYLTLIFPVAANGAAPRVCQIGMSMADIEARLGKYAALLLGIGTVVVLVGALTSHWLVRRPLRIIDAMNRQAREITARAMHLRLPDSGAGDEFDDLARTLNTMLDRLDDAMRRLTQFTADAAHELRTPLARMRTAAEITLHGEHCQKDQREALSAIVEQSEELGRLVDNLLLLARSGTETAGIADEPVDCDALLQETISIYEALADNKGVTMELGRADQGRISGNLQHMRRALGNLIENAIKFTEPGGKVDLSGAADTSVYRIAVVDTGRGIPQEHLPYIFDRFYRADAARSRPDGGTGLGLSIVKAIVEAHGGTVEAASSVGQGSRFTVTLPLRKSG